MENISFNNVFLASPNSLHDPEWYFDSGASNHVTHDSDQLHQEDAEHKGKQNLVVGNGEKLSILTIGFATLNIGQKQLYMHSILYVPNIRTKEIPVHQEISGRQQYQSGRQQYDTAFSICTTFSMSQEGNNICSPRNTTSARDQTSDEKESNTTLIKQKLSITTVTATTTSLHRYQHSA